MKKAQIAVVTGATKGIGKAVVELLAEKGFDVWFCARSSSAVMLMQAQLAEKYPTQHFWGVVCDLGTALGREVLASSLQKELSHIDVLLNNTGVFMPGGILTEAPGVLEQQVETNLYSAYHVTRAAFPLLQQSELAHIFNMCSTASLTAYVNGGSYAITKFGLLGMTKVLREELKPYGIKVTAILPGATKTASWEGTNLEDSRFMQAEDVAKALWACYDLGPTAVVEELLMRPLPGDIG